MSIRNLERLLKPKSVVLVGASDREGSIGHTTARNLVTGGFSGAVSFVNAHHREIEGRPCFARVRDLPVAADLAVLATPPATIPDIAAELAGTGTRAMVVLSAGVDAPLRQRMLDAGQAQALRVLGPNCIGLLLPRLGLNASFAHRTTKPGKLAFLSQSGALVTAIIDWAAGRDIGFSHIVSLGDMADVDFGDLLDYLAGDPECEAILMYVEGITHAPKFMSAARRAARVKPVIVIKSGRHASSANAAHSHTGALAGSDAAYAAAFRRAGVLRVTELHELFAAAEMVAASPKLRGDKLAILTNGGGAGVLAADDLADLDGRLAQLGSDTLAALDAAMPATWSHGNPVDIIGDADAGRYVKALDVLLADSSSDAILVINCPTALHSSTEVAKAVIAMMEKRRGSKPLITNWLGAETAEPARRLFTKSGLPTFETPSDAVGGFMQLVRYSRAQEALSRTPALADETDGIDRAVADAVIARALEAGRRTLSEAEGKAILAAYGIPVVDTEIATTPEAAVQVAERMLKSAPGVVLKILSDDITHKSDAGGVRLGLRSAEAVKDAATQMLAHIKETLPKAVIRGFTVSPFVQKAQAHELILGITEDKTFGPLILFGAGGTSVEVTKDTALALPPLDMMLAEDLMQQTRIFSLLRGYRDRGPADLKAIATALVRLSLIAANHPEVRELDINPLLVDGAGAVALDARVRIEDAAAVPRVPMAVHPYPADWRRELALPELGIGDGRIVLRPIRPEDEHLYEAFFTHVTEEDRRLRFFSPAVDLSHGFIKRLTQIDYAREIAFVALSKASGELLGVSRFFADPDYRAAEFAVMVRSDLKGRGLGWLLMKLLVDYAAATRLRELYGSVLEDNTTMLRMCRELGFTVKPGTSGAGVVEMRMAVPRGEK